MNSGFLDPRAEDRQSSLEVSHQIDWVGESEWTAIFANFSKNTSHKTKTYIDSNSLPHEFL